MITYVAISRITQLCGPSLDLWSVKRVLIIVKGKIFPVLCEALHHEGIWAGGTALQHFQPDQCVNGCAQLHIWATLTPGKELLFKY